MSLDALPYGGRTLRSFHFRAFLALWLFATMVSLLLHARSFYVVHDEGDELVYLTLAREMNWDLSHYTTQDVPSIRALPFSIYRQPLFHQPPLFPLVLKVGGLLGNPIATGLVFANLSMILLLFFTWRWMVRVEVTPDWASAACAGVTLCPLLLASTTILHIDGLLGIYLACGLIAYVEALETPSPWRAILAGLLLVIALNLRYNGLMVLPLIPLLQVYQLRRLAHAATGGGRSAWLVGRNWTTCAIVSALVLTLGLLHYYRIHTTYGTIRPGRFILEDPGMERYSDYLRLLRRREPWRLAVALLPAVFPFLVVFLTPWPYLVVWRTFRERSLELVPLAAFLLLMPLEYMFSCRQMRYFAAEMPLLYLSTPLLLRSSRGRVRAALLGLGSLSLFLMATTGFARTVMAPPDAIEIIPSLYYFLPPLMRNYH